MVANVINALCSTCYIIMLQQRRRRRRHMSKIQNSTRFYVEMRFDTGTQQPPYNRLKTMKRNTNEKDEEDGKGNFAMNTHNKDTNIEFTEQQLIDSSAFFLCRVDERAREGGRERQRQT